ncbi:MAG: ERAP1-like C-terminal domain-containing protein, partial [Caulobacterales bacterium]|nr:ERAP1-like C-terminal domain-containing protein [Caulobacterales bacterium]
YQLRAFASVMAHELAHMWFGNLVTMPWWDDIWLNEAFATWMGNKATDAWSPDGNYDRETLRDALSAMELDSLAATRRVREPVESNDTVQDAFDAITYLKGGGVLSMIESYLGETAFRNGVRAYMAKYADSVATADDFFEAIAEGSGRPEVVSAFRSFVDQAGVPLITTSLSCQGETPSVTVSQSSYRPLGSAIPGDRRWEVPLCVAYGAGEERAKTCTLLSEQEATFPLETETCPSSLMPNAEGAGYYRFTFADGGWGALMDDFDALPAKEAIAAADSLSAAFAAGEIDAAAYLDGVETLTRSPLWDVASAPAFELLSLANTHRLRGRDLEALRAFILSTYRPLLEAARDGDREEDELLADTLTAVLVRGARDGALIAALAEQGEAFLEADGHLGAEGGPPAYALSDALTAGVWTKGGPFFEELLALTKDAANPVIRVNAVAALARVHEPKLARRVRETAMSGDLSGRELYDVLRYQMAQPETRDEAWEWLTANFAEVIEQIPDVRRSSTPALASSFASRRRASEVEAFFTDNADLIPGYERSLAQTLESIRLKAAFDRRQRRQLGRALRDRL